MHKSSPWRRAMPELRRRLRRLLLGLGETAHLMVGLPDYRRYVAHRLALHPSEPMMSRAEFVAERSARRYGGAGTGRCC